MLLLQSHENVLRFFPVWPKDQDARFGNLRAKGAFLVSAELEKRKVKNVIIESEKGTDCAVQNPWPEEKVVLYRNGRKKGGRIERYSFYIYNEKGETIILVPDSQRVM